MNLFREFARGSQDQSAYLPRRFLGQPLQDGQDKCRRFAGAGLSQSDDISALEYDGNGLLLDGSGCVITGGLDGGGDSRVERKLFEIQKMLLGSIEPSRNLSPMTRGKSLCRL